MRYGAMEAAAFGDLLDTLSREEIIENVITGLNIAYLRGAADVFASIGKEAGNKVEAILVKDPFEFDETTRSAVAGGLLAYEAVRAECQRQYDKANALGRELVYSGREQAPEGFDEMDALMKQLEAELAALATEEAMNEAPRDNAQIEGSSIPGAEAAR